METRRRKRDLGKETLPGDRRGVPGADAGHSSMQTIGGSDLSRRNAAGQPEKSTADNRTQTTTQPNTTQYHNTQDNTNPAMGALREQPVREPSKQASQDSAYNGHTIWTKLSCAATTLQQNWKQ